ncbi:[protein-PII] uridylyltransferase [Methylomarinovum tepidoasis]|uniref:Bifunctional uridylyltransferase/uridylyl-removing enzyme n=1 Tax=Methylomarinovum tepidoasis TaxID=2840183 RepID=A0AAU9CKU2_9GAMM|nr:[protein-PII] uridylyltransferase [Methylomarinovum sp. IN45]BCX88237.1 [protein-PII] uridylyltransferase [Methylomarinovum sp. IN45]
MTDLAALKHALQAFHDELAQRFRAGAPIESLIHARADFVDALLRGCWRRLGDHAATAALVAVGGYGRRELHPHSDIDLLVLVPEAPPPALTEKLGRLFTLLWDIGLKPGHSVRTVPQCLEAAATDQTVVTNLMDARRLDGDPDLFAAMKAGIAPQRLWPSDAFFRAKLAEQEARYAKYHDTAYNLEPNLKEGPGGLRDIQTVAWVIKRHFDTATLRELVARGFLDEAEYAELRRALHHLWRVRFALHLLAGRCEDRLLFDYQRDLARQFGHRGDGNAPVEAFMQDYFRTARSVQCLNEILLQRLGEALNPGFRAEAQILDDRFQIVNGYLEIRRPELFRQDPLTLLEVFLQLQRHPELKGIRADTVRAIRRHLHLIDDRFRADPKACRLFLEIFRQPAGVTHQLRRMNRYGVLAAYLPEFARIVGRMQYDLFHSYTVDAHILFTVRNLRRLGLPRHRDEVPFAAAVFPQLSRPEILYLAGLYHDMGKGWGGDHSVIGERLARAFCRRHGLDEHDTELICWLVRHHLLMSVTAQRKDIQDPDVVAEFACQVGNEERLDHLYLLTVADIRATNPTLWNSWRDSLLQELYLATRRVLRQGKQPIDARARIDGRREAAIEQLRQLGLDTEAVRPVWNTFSHDYFLRCHPDECVWHTVAIAATADDDLPLVMIRPHDHRGSTDVFIYMRDRDGIFAHTVALLDRLGLTILTARLDTTDDGYAVNSFRVLERDGTPITELAREQQIAQQLKRCLKTPTPHCFRITRRPGRQLRHFSLPTQVRFSEDAKGHTVMELVAADRPGLLAAVAKVFDEFGLRLHEARISTLGQRAEDVFHLTDRCNLPLAEDRRRQLAARLTAALGGS